MAIKFPPRFTLPLATVWKHPTACAGNNPEPIRDHQTWLHFQPQRSCWELAFPLKLNPHLHTFHGPLKCLV